MKGLLLIATILAFIDCQIITSGILDIGFRRFKSRFLPTDRKIIITDINEYFQSKKDYRPRFIKQILEGTKEYPGNQNYRLTIYTVFLEVSGGKTNELCRVVIHIYIVFGERYKEKVQNPKCEAMNYAKIPKIPTNISDPVTQEAIQFVEAKVNDYFETTNFIKMKGLALFRYLVIRSQIFEFYNMTFAESYCMTQEVKLNPGMRCPLTENAAMLLKCTFVVVGERKGPPSFRFFYQSCTDRIRL